MVSLKVKFASTKIWVLLNFLKLPSNFQVIILTIGPFDSFSYCSAVLKTIARFSLINFRHLRYNSSCVFRHPKWHHYQSPPFRLHEFSSLTISTTSTSASIRKWYKKIFKSFLIWIELSSICAIVNILILQFFHVRCCFNKNGNNISKPPSWTTHQTSMLPPIFEAVSGKKLIPFGTSRAMREVLTERTVCKKACHDRLSSSWRHPYGHPRITVLGFSPPRPVVWTLLICEKQLKENGEKAILLSQNRID